MAGVARGDQAGGRRRCGRRKLTGHVAWMVLASSLGSACSWVGGDDDVPVAWFVPLIDGGPATLADLCAADTCVGDVVQLPVMQPIDAVVDLALPDTLGPLSVERLWTGSGGGIFGSGWRSVWDLRLDGGTISGPLPAPPLAAPLRGEAVPLADGSSVTFGVDGAVSEICVDASPCVRASWGQSSLTLAPATPTGVSITLDLDDGRVRRAASSDGRAVSYEYVDGQLTNVSGQGMSTSYRYEGARLAAVDDGVSSRIFEYTPSGTLASAFDRDGAEWTFDRDGDALTVGRPEQGLVTYRFDDERLAVVEDGTGQVLLRREWTDAGLRREERPPEGLVLERLDDGRYQATQSVAGSPPRIARYTLDSLGRVVATESSSGETSIEFVGATQRPKRKVANGARTEFEYDEVGRLTRVVDADGYEVRVERNAMGLPVALTDGLITTAFEYDEAGRTTLETSGGLSASASYGANGLLDTVTMAGGDAWTASYARGALMSLGDEPIEPFTFADGSATTDNAAEATVDEGPDGGVSYRYADGTVVAADNWGRITMVTVKGRTSVRTYDEYGRISSVREPDGTTYELEYTPAGRVQSVSDGTVSSTFEWHGDALVSATLSTGTTYRYEYNPDGSLSRALVGETEWSYGYSPAGDLELLAGPSESARYEWDSFGRPTAITRAGRQTTIEWLGTGSQLQSVLGEDGDTVTVERDSAGRTTSISTNEASSAFEYGASGSLTAYELEGVGRVELSSSDGRVDSLRFDDHVEHWLWEHGELRTVTTESGDSFLVDWLLPGIPSRISLDGHTVVAVRSDEAGRPAVVADRDGSTLGELSWSPGGLSSLTADDTSVVIERDDEHRVTSIADGDESALWSFSDGGLASFSAMGTSVVLDRDDRRVVGARVVSGDLSTAVTWNAAAGRPTAFASEEGSGSFEYVGNRVSTISYDDRVRDVSYDDDSTASADGTGQEFLDDLFTDGGHFRSFGGHGADTPPAPWFDSLPSVLGVALPDVTTGDDVVEQALEEATPSVPLPLIGGADVGQIADRTWASVAAVAATVPVLVSPDRVVELDLLDDRPLDALLAGSSFASVADSAGARLAGGTCLLCRVGDIAGSLAGDVADAVGSAARFVANSPVGRAIAAVTFYAASAVLAFACSATSPLCLLAPTVLSIGLAYLLDPGAGLVAVIASVILAPYIELVRGVRSGDPRAIMSAAELAFELLTRARGLPFGTAFGGRTLRSTCALRRVVCVSASRFGQAAEHVVDAQQQGAPRLLRLDRGGAVERRLSALRNVPVLQGFDRDEYPFAVSSVRTGLSIRYVDPGSNRSLGAYLARELSQLPDGSLFLVLPVS